MEKQHNFKELIDLTANGFKVVLSTDSTTGTTGLLISSEQQTPLNSGTVAYYFGKKSLKVKKFLFSTIKDELTKLEKENEYRRELSERNQALVKRK